MSSVAAPIRPAERLRTYASFVRFEHTLFSLPLIFAAVFSVPGPALSWSRWGLVAIAAVGARTAAMSLNRIIDRRLDALNPRTRTRELPAGAMRGAEAWGLLVVSVAAYLGACAALGPWFLRVSPVPLAAFALYPYLKRFTPLCHFGVGLALALAPLAGYAAAHPDLARPAPALWLGGFALTWVAGFDVIYATLDEGSDRAHRVRSMVAWLGRARALRVSAVLHLLAWACAALAVVELARLGPASPAALLPGVVLLAAVGALLYLEQQWAEDVNLAFFKVNVWVGACVLAMTLAARMWTGGL
jgi:4-hydroxybenzoate polyprenyltransferase